MRRHTDRAHGLESESSGATTAEVTTARTERTTVEPAQRTATAMSSESTKVSRRVGMPQSMPLPGAALKRPTIQSACLRLHERHGDSPKSWENRMCGEASDYQRVARMNRVLCDLGMHDKVAELMAPIEASLAAAPCAEGLARYREQLTDAEEDVLQARFEADPSVETLRPLLQKRAQMRQASLDYDTAEAARFNLSL